MRNIENELTPHTEKLPTSGDANGAYNIARKGMLMATHIRESEQSEMLPNLYIGDAEWDLWLSHREKWNSQLTEFALSKTRKKS